jgi:uncharacterized membrane protein
LTSISIFASEEHGRDIDIVLDEILQSTQALTLSEVSPDTVPSALLEELGDGVMSLLLNDEWYHERMDAMLGGEGSSQLAAYHRDLGEQYISADGNLNELNSYYGRGMMTGGMMGFSRYSQSGSRWNRWDMGSHSWLWGLPVIIGLLVLIILTVAHPTIRKRRKPDSQALIILQNRFAKGEISKQEFEKMKKIIG